MSRSSERSDFSEIVRIRLLENDVDEQETDIRQVIEEFKSMKNILIGFLVSLTTASILLAANLLVDKL